MDLSVIETFIQQKQLKTYIPFLKLAKDTYASNPRVSYWALYYIIHAGIQSQSKDAEFRSFLAEIMTQLEKEKVFRKSDPQFFNEEESKKFIDDYGNQLLVRAEQDAELGVSPGVTMKLYVTASNVYQILSVFGVDTEENAKRIKYCKWKAVSTFKEAKNEPPPPPPCDDFVLPKKTDEPGPDNNVEVGKLLPDIPEPQDHQFVPPVVPSSSSPDEINFENLSLTDSDLKKAELLCESALYAIKSRDIFEAVTSLKQTLKTLQKS